MLSKEANENIHLLNLQLFPESVLGFGEVGEGVSELRIDYGPGYRVYFKKMGQKVIILLAGGDKKNQSKDINTALGLSRNL